jgi:hypothetical protein
MSDPQKEASGESPAPAETTASTDEKKPGDGIWADSPKPVEASEPKPEPKPEPAPNQADDGEEPDLDNRVLCPDGACIGVIGPDGRCKVCGKRGEAPAPRPARPAGDSTAPATAAVSAAAEPEEDDGDSPDLRDRKLCSDGNCIGVIGPDGNCKVCGKPYTGEPEL